MLGQDAGQVPSLRGRPRDQKKKYLKFRLGERVSISIFLKIKVSAMPQIIQKL